MRSVRRATCTSGEPVSLPERWYCLTTCAFCGTCNAIRLSLFRDSASIFRAGDFNRCTAASQGFSMFISRLSEPEGAQLALGMRTSEADQRAVSSVERAQACLQSTDFQRLTVTQPRFGGGVELGGRKIGEQFAQAQQAHLGRWQSAQLVDCHRVLYAKAAGAGAAQRRQMSSSAERSADVLAKRADVCPFAATDAQLGERRLVAEQPELGDPHRARGALYAAAFARQLVQGYAVALQRRMHRRHLVDRPAEARERRFHVGRGGADRARLKHLPL